MKNRTRNFQVFFPVLTMLAMSGCLFGLHGNASPGIGELPLTSARASSVQLGKDPAAAIQVAVNTYWQAATDDDERWWHVDLGRPSDLLEVRLAWLSEEAVGRFAVEVSEDAVRWYRVAENVGAVDSVALLEMHRRFVRVRVTAAADPGRIGLRKVAVLGRPSAPLPVLPAGPETRGWARPSIPLLPVTVAGVKEPVQSLNGIWSYTNVPPRGFWRNDADLCDWNRVPVPGNLAVLLGMDVMKVENPDGEPWDPQRNVESVYKRRIIVPESFAGKRVLLRFDAAFTYARVWVNEHLVGTHRGGFTPFYVDATDVVEAGEEAWVTVGLTAESPSVEYTHVRGLVADVSLVAMARDFPSRLQVHTEFDLDYRDAMMRIETGIVFHENEVAEIVLQLTDMDGREVDLGDGRIRVTAANPDIAIERKINRPRHWTAEDPYLYTLSAAVRVNGETVQTIERRIGFREVEVRGNKLYVNGRQVKLRGANWHQADPHRGIAVNREHDLKSLRMLREANVNHIRASHWPQFKYVLDAADELGFYLLQENSIMMVGWRGREKMLNDPRYLDAFMGQFADMVELSQSHPSVIMWSTGNESRWGSNIRETQLYAHEIDREKRPTIFSWGHQAPKDGYEVFSHHYPGLGETYSRQDVPVLFDEYAHLYTHNDGWIEYDPAFRDFYGDSLRYFWDHIYAADGGLGGAIWHARDKLFFQKEEIWRGFAASWGLLDVWNRSKPELHHVRMAYSPIRIAQRVLSAGSEPLAVEIENRFHHTDLSQLKVYWKVGDETGAFSGPSLAPMATGTLSLPDREWKLGEKLLMSFVKQELNGEPREIYVHRFEVGRPVVDFGSSALPAPRVEEKGDQVMIAGAGFEIQLDRNTGQIVEWQRDEETVVVGGPHLNLGYNGQLPGHSKPAPATWRLRDFAIERMNARVKVSIQGEYEGGVAARFDLEVDGAGVMDATYRVMEAPADSSAIGIAFDVVPAADRISWVRRGLWPDYPEDHIGRQEGVAYRNRQSGTDEIYAEKPGHPWSQDEKDFHLFGPDDPAGRGTRDFRSSRHDNLVGSLLLAGSDLGLQAAGPEGGSLKATVNADGTVRLDINSLWSHPGFTGWGGNPYHRSIGRASGYSDRITVRLTDEGVDDSLVYVRPEDYEATALSGLEVEGGRLGDLFDPTHRYYSIVTYKLGAEVQLQLTAVASGSRIRVNGEPAGTGTAHLKLRNVGQDQIVRVDIEHEREPIRRTYLLSLVHSQNLALERPAEASSALGQQPGRYLVDGDLSNRWSSSDTGERSGVGCDEWVRVDLQEPFEIARWVVHHERGEEIYRTRDFRLEYSADGPDGPWQTADEVVGNTDAVTDRQLRQPVEARFFRLRVTKKTGEGAQWPAIRIGEFELYGPNSGEL